MEYLKTFKSHRVQAEYEKFLKGERNCYSPLFIRGVIPKPKKFHQQFELYVKLMPLEDNVVAGPQNFTNLNTYFVDNQWVFPNRRWPTRGCNDICWGCGKWCVKVDNVPKFHPYVCLIGRFRSERPRVPDPVGMLDPVDQKYPSPIYPFLCWGCYRYDYKHLISVKFFDCVYVIDHAFVMNRDRYNLHRRYPNKWFTHNLKWSRLGEIPLKVLALLNDQGKFVFHETQNEEGCEVTCAFCGDRILSSERGVYIEGSLARAGELLPIITYVNGELKSQFRSNYVHSCLDCHGEDDAKFYYPCGFKFKVDGISYIND